ncbi:hypothetical protein PMES_02429 [Profundibacterium mesophilum KAUST100406-0324]|uniref:Uncharacterized protein n=1 Tax=Profundibacterium mesophilum KAUST100406-0324 TaxID=1037889 RepID=A0A921NPD6_9RHOB|nr:hypothetical protein PMES_02429 [Profundibacterium mesophilum KAUST100406-0324]
MAANLRIPICNAVVEPGRENRLVPPDVSSVPASRLHRRMRCPLAELLRGPCDQVTGMAQARGQGAAAPGGEPASLGQGRYGKVRLPGIGLHATARQKGIADPAGHGRGICPIWFTVPRMRNRSAPG